MTIKMKMTVKMKMKAIPMAMVSCGLCFGSHSFAAEKLDTVNAQVEQKAIEIDQKHGVLLDTFERNELKMDLIIKQVTADTENNSGKTVKAITDAAIATYQITDPTAQRKLLIKMEAQQKSTGSSGNEPKYP